MDSSDIEEYLAELARRDEEIGRRAEARVAGIYGAGDSLEGYRFENSFARDDQATHRVDWVHQDRWRTARFVYRHMPRPLRYGLKRMIR